MEPLPPTPLNRFLAMIAGFVVGIGVQIFFLYMVTHVIGPIPNGFNGKLVAWIALLLAPPTLSFLFIRIAPGSVAEDFFKGFQLASIAWFILIIASALPSVRGLLN